MEDFINQHFEREFTDEQKQALIGFLSSINLQWFIESKLYKSIKHKKDYLVPIEMINWDIESYIWNPKKRKQRFEHACNYIVK